MGLFNSIFGKNENDGNDEDYDEHIDSRYAIRPQHHYDYEAIRRQFYKEQEENNQSYTDPAVSDMSKMFADCKSPTEKDSLQELYDLRVELDDLKSENRSLKKHILDIKAKLS